MRHKVSSVLIAAALVGLAVSGCSKSHGSGDGSVKPLLAAFNAAPDMPDVTFLRVEEVPIEHGVRYRHGVSLRRSRRLHAQLRLAAPGDETSTCQGGVNKVGVKNANECARRDAVVNVVNGHSTSPR
jgi:hypothetical protein